MASNGQGSSTSEAKGPWSFSSSAEANVEDSEGVPGSSGTNNVNRHSVPMKLQLRLIESNVARLMKEREQLESIQNMLSDAEAEMRKEVEYVNKMMKYCHSTALNKMTPEEWKEFYQKMFCRDESSNAEEQEGSWQEAYKFEPFNIKTEPSELESTTGELDLD